MKQNPVLIDTERETRSFFLFMTVVLTGMAVWAASSQPDLRQPPRLIAFILLVAAHIALHWIIERFLARRRGFAVYAVAQSALVAGAVYLSRDLGLTFAMAMGLVGEMIGLYGISMRGLLGLVYYLGLALGVYLLVVEGVVLDWWAVGLAAVMVTFVVIYVELYNRQANANQRAQELLRELEAANRQLTDYAAQVEDLTIAAERQRMARELHDTLSQGLAGLILQLEAADAHLAGGRTDKARQIVQQTMENARATLSGARRAIDNLRQGVLEGSVEALHSETRRFSEAAGIPCVLEMDLPDGLPDRLREPVLKIVAECLANIARHARATQASVHLGVEDGSLSVRVCDDGAGFDPSAVPAGHYGLLGMRERARMAGGELNVESSPGRGTTVIFKVDYP